MHDAVKKVVDPFLASADRALGDRYSAVLYGSAVRGDYLPGTSNINLLLVIDEIGPATLRALGPAVAAWRQTVREPPLLLTRPEWLRAADVFPVEITDVRTAYQVLRGADPLTAVTVHRADLRRALERELRGKLLRLRQGYAALVTDPDALTALAAESASTVLLLLRAILVLVDRPVPHEPLELASAAAAAVGFQTEDVALVIRHRTDREWRCSPTDFECYLEAVEYAARFIDQLQLGDE